jgi:hypothetical protein
VIDYYRVEMEKALNSNQFLSVDVFDDVEDGVKGKARKLFKQKCSCGDSSFIQSFDNKFRNIISNLKYDFREQSLRKRERVIVDYEIASIDLLDEFEESLAQFSSTCDSPRSFEGKCKELMPQCLAKFDKICSLPEFRVKLENKLISKIKSSVKEFNTKSDNKSIVENKKKMSKSYEIMSKVIYFIYILIRF